MMHYILGITAMVWQRMSQRPWTCTLAYSGEISPVANDLSHCQAISWIFQSASAGGISPVGQCPRAGTDTSAWQLFVLQVFHCSHLPPSVLSQPSAPAPRGQPYRGTSGSEPLGKPHSPPPTSFISFPLASGFIVRVPFMAWQQSGGQVAIGWILSGSFEFPSSAVEHWPVLFHVLHGGVTPLSNNS